MKGSRSISIISAEDLLGRLKHTLSCPGQRTAIGSPRDGDRDAPRRAPARGGSSAGNPPHGRARGAAGPAARPAVHPGPLRTHIPLGGYLLIMDCDTSTFISDFLFLTLCV